jgi:hypothetical protein
MGFIVIVGPIALVALAAFVAVLWFNPHYVPACIAGYRARC